MKKSEEDQKRYQDEMVKWRAASAKVRQAIKTDKSLVPPTGARSAHQIWLNQNREIIRRDHPGLHFMEFSKKATDLWNALIDKSVSIYTDLQKHESTLLHTYVLNEFLTADRLCTAKYF